MADDRMPLLARPERVMIIHLDDAEEAAYRAQKNSKDAPVLVHWTSPSARAYLFANWPIPAALLGVGLVSLLFLVLLRNSFGRAVSGVLLLILGLMFVALQIRLFFRTFTRYVLTPNRLMRMEGIFTKTVSAVQLLAISDVTSETGVVGQFLDFGTVKVETANEASKFGDLNDVPKPQQFLDLLNFARSNKERPPKAAPPTPLSEEMLRTIVNVGSMLTAGELVVEPTTTGGWRIKREQEPSAE